MRKNEKELPSSKFSFENDDQNINIQQGKSIRKAVRLNSIDAKQKNLINLEEMDDNKQAEIIYSTINSKINSDINSYKEGKEENAFKSAKFARKSTTSHAHRNSSTSKRYENKIENKPIEIGELIYIDDSYNCNEKYGVGYILNNGDIGVLFRDLTKVLLIKNTRNVVYSDQNEIENYAEEDFEQINKNKDKILKLFSEYFINKRKDKESFQENVFKQIPQDPIYVKKILSEKYADFYLFSNNNIQVIFRDDNSSIIYFFDYRKIKYINPVEQKDKLEDFPPDYSKIEEGMKKRLHYAKKVLSKNLKNDGK